MKRSWIQDPETGKLIPKEEYVSRQLERIQILPDLQPFVSPVTGEIISSRSRLREHNLRHGVTQTADYGDDWFTRKAKERADALSGKSNKAERLNDLLASIYRHEEQR